MCLFIISAIYRQQLPEIIYLKLWLLSLISLTSSPQSSHIFIVEVPHFADPNTNPIIMQPPNLTRSCFPRAKIFSRQLQSIYKHNTKNRCANPSLKFPKFYSHLSSSKPIAITFPSSHLKKADPPLPALIICPFLLIKLYLQMRATTLIRYTFARHTRYCILGGGSGGLNISTHLLRSGVHPSEIRMIDPSHNHYYQPGWTMVGAGMWQIHSTSVPMDKVIPSNITREVEKVKLVKPDDNTIICESGKEFTYDQLIIGTGLRLQYEKIQGLKEALNDPNSMVGSIYQLNYAQKLAKMGEKIKSGKAIFTEPAMPIKCAGAPQKILYLWTDKWQQKQLPIDVEFYKTNAVMFGVPKYSETLSGVAAEYNIKTTFKTPLIKVQGNEATFQNLDTKEITTKKFDFLHVVPPMGAHEYIAESGLADATGFLDCNKNTMRHSKYSNIWGIGDCTNVPSAKTAAAIFSQTEVLHDNLLAVRNNPTTTTLPGSYQGYASCPLFVGKYKLMLAEFKFGGVIDETFYKDQEKPRYEFYFMKRFIFPLAYWLFVPRGLWAGRKGIRWV